MNSNLIKRSVTGLLFVIILVGAIVSHPIAFVALFSLVSAYSTFELAGLLNNTGQVVINKAISSLASFYLFIAFAGFAYNLTSSVVFIPYLGIILYLFVSELYLNRANPIGNLGATALTQIYIGLPFALINTLAFVTNEVTLEPTYHYILPLSLFVFLWVSDSGAYLVGSLIGKRKLFERISPNKSWEGSIGGGVFAVIAAIILSHFFTFLSLPQWIGFALIIVVFGTWGDLTESLMKRQLQIKDSGNILPGHGGFLDRFDSTILAIPAAVLYLFLIKLV